MILHGVCSLKTTKKGGGQRKKTPKWTRVEHVFLCGCTGQELVRQPLGGLDGWVLTAGLCSGANGKPPAAHLQKPLQTAKREADQIKAVRLLSFELGQP